MSSTEKTHTERYKIVHDRILEQIRTERLKKGDKILSERKLCDKYDVSMITVRKALDMLVDENVIEKHQGSGNYVRELKKARIALLLNSRYDMPPLTVQMLREVNDASSAFELVPHRMDRLSSFEIKQFLVEQEMPCIVMASDGFDDIARHNMLLPLDNMKGFDDIISDVPGNVDFRGSGPDGLVRHFMLPLFVSPSSFAVNLDLAEKSGLPTDRAPNDWSEMLEWCARFQEWSSGNGGNMFATYSRPDRLLSGNLSYLFMSLGSGSLSEDLQELVNPEVGDFIGLLSDMISRGYMDVSEQVRAGGQESFLDGRYLFCMSARPAVAIDLERFAPGFAHALYPLPPKTPNGRRVSSLGSVRMGIARMNAEDPHTREACWRAIRDILSYSRLNEVAYEMKCYPASVSGMRKLVASKSILKVFFESIPNYQLQPSSELSRRKRVAIDSFLSLYMADKEAPDVPLSAVIKVVRRLASEPSLVMDQE